MAQDNPPLISSQRYLDPDIVQEKIDDSDFLVHVYEIEVYRQPFWVVVDGHHSLAAARQVGQVPEIKFVERAVAKQYEYEIACGGIDGWLTSHWIDTDWYFVETGQTVF